MIGGSKPLFTLYEGPPTANGTPGIHHVLARVFKDVIPRYKTMKGFRTQRKGGWDTHGLPVELEVEKELGISTKQEIEEIVELASRWENCTIISDEIYDRLNFNGNHISTASVSYNVPVITLNGVSKVYYAPGWRIGYMALHDPINKLSNIKDGLERLLRSRLCASTPAQYGYLAGLNDDDTWMNDYLSTLKERNDVCVSLINDIEGLSVEKPQGAFYMFIKLTENHWNNRDKDFVLDLLHRKHVLTVHGSGFSNQFGKNHFRVVFLPSEKILIEAFNRIDDFLNERRN